jgi:nitronate monooxygenase
MLGCEGGGLPGSDFVSSSVLWPKAAETLKIPVIAAGGICDSRSFAAAMACGCEGVTVGSRFFMAKECPIGPRIKERLISAQETDTVITQRSINNPCRCFKNTPSTAIVEYEETEHPTFEQLYPRIRGTLVKAAYEADEYDQSYFSIGEDIGRINNVLSAKEIIQEMVTGYEEIVRKMAEKV